MSAGPQTNRSTESTDKSDIVVDVQTLGNLVCDFPDVQWLGPEDGPNTVVSGIAIASNNVQPGWVFVAVPGEYVHGAKYAAAAKAAGAVAIVTDNAGAALAAATGLPVAIIANPRTQVGLLGAKLYSSALQTLLKVGVTGTNGKTTTTYFTRAALQAKYGQVGLMGTIEVDTGYRRERQIRTTAEAPVLYQNLAEMSAWGMRAAVVEASSHAFSLGRVNGLVFDVGIFTNLQHDHLDYYDTMEKYFAAKAELFTPQRSRRGVVCVDDEWGLRLAQSATVPVDTVAVLSDNKPDNAQAHWYVTDIEPELPTGAMTFNLHSPSGSVYRAASPLPGKVNVQDAALALVAASKLGVPVTDAIESLKQCEPIAGRCTWVLGDVERQPRCMVDYAHTPEALQALLETIRPFTSGQLVLVFGTDGDRDASKREDLAEYAARGADVLWITDENPRWEDPQSVRGYLLRGVARVRPDFAGVTEVKTCRRDAIRKAIQAAKPGDVVLVTGKGAEPYQEIEGVFYPYSDEDEIRTVLRNSLNLKQPKGARNAH